MQGPILVLGLSPGLQKTISFDAFVPGRVNRARSSREDASGKCTNVARVLTQLEAGSAHLVCPLGHDNEARFRALLEKDEVPLHVVEVPGATRWCWTLLDDRALFGEEQDFKADAKRPPRMTELVVDEPAPHTSSLEAAAQRMSSYLEQELSRDEGRPAALVIAGSRPAGWPETFYPAMVALAKKQGVPVLVDYRGEDLLTTLALAAPDIVKINEDEFRESFACDDQSEQALVAALSRESSLYHTTMVVTRGPKAVLAAASGIPVQCDVEGLDASNEIGSGDAFDAGFIFTWTRGGSLAACLEKGIECARLNALSLRPGSLR